jgi:glycine cleavage system aminomethyltransferase T
VARTALHAWHCARGARFGESDGWQIPLVYTSVQAEVEAARTGLGLADISACSKKSLIGPDVPDSLGPVRPGEVAPMPENGAGVACRLTADHLLLIAASTRASFEKRLAGMPTSASLILLDVTTAYAGMCLLGPDLETVLPQLTNLELPEGRCAETGLAGIPALLIRPPGFTLPALQIFVSWDLAEYAWEWLLELGRKRSLTPLGWDALDALRMNHR